METVEVAAAVFAMLGLPDDKGLGNSPPYSARSVWNICSRAHRDYFNFDPTMVAAATEAVIYGVMAHFFKYQWAPCVDGKNASSETPKFLVVGNSDHIKGLAEVCAKLEARSVKESNHHSDLDAIPGAQERWLAGGAPGGKRPCADAADDADPKRVRSDAVAQDWLTSANMASKPDGFHIGHLIYDLRAMEADAIKKGLLQAKVAGEINLYALVVRKIMGNDKRVGETKKFAPSAKVHFEGRTESWARPVQEIFQRVNASFYKTDTRGPSSAGAAGGSKGKSGGGGKGGGSRGPSGRQVAGTALALMPPAARSSHAPSSTNASTPAAPQDAVSVVRNPPLPPPPRDAAPNKEWTLLVMRTTEPPYPISHAQWCEVTASGVDVAALRATYAPPPSGVWQAPSAQKPSLTPLRPNPSPHAPLPRVKAEASAKLPWPVQVINAIRKGTGAVYDGFSDSSVKKATGYLTFLMLSCLIADPAAPNFLLIGDRSGKLMSHLQRRGFRPLCVDPQGCQQPGLTYKGFAEDIAYSRHWRGAFISTPCDDDAWCGSTYFKVKMENGTHYWSMYLSVFCWCIPADAVLFEHPLTILEHMWRMSDQTIHPYYFGPDDNGKCLWKTTLLWIRGWKLVTATNVMAGDPKDLKHAIKNFDPVARTQLRSDFTWNMAEALVAQCNPDTIIEGAAQPVLAVELALLATNYARKYGSAALPAGHSNMQGLFPPVVNYSASQRHREQIRADAHLASGRPTPPWPPVYFADPAGNGHVITRMAGTAATRLHSGNPELTTVQVSGAHAAVPNAAPLPPAGRANASVAPRAGPGLSAAIFSKGEARAEAKRLLGDRLRVAQLAIENPPTATRSARPPPTVQASSRTYTRTGSRRSTPRHTRATLSALRAPRRLAT